MANGTPDQFWTYVDQTGHGCWEWRAGRNRHGYGLCYLGGRRSKTTLTHRRAWELTVGPIPDGMVVCHRCDNPACCRVDHLFLGSQLDNIADTVSKERHVRGERVPHAKLTDEAVREIRERYAAGGVLQRELAQEYGVAQGIISSVVRRDAWKHVA